MDMTGVGVAGQLAAESRSVLQRLQPQVQEFEQVLAQMSQMAQQGKERGQNPAVVLQQVSRQELVQLDPANSDALYVEKLQQAQEPGGVERLLDQLQSDWRRMDEIVDQLLSGDTFSVQQLFALQVEAHNLALNVEMGAKAAEKVVHGAQELLRQNL
jgi:hypothetical protein